MEMGRNKKEYKNKVLPNMGSKGMKTIKKRKN